MSWVAAGIASAELTYKAYKTISQNRQASKIEKANQFPTETVQPEYQQNVNQAQQMSQVGLPQQQYNNTLNSIQQNQTGALGALSRSANPAAGLASVVRQGDAATGNLNAQDAVARNRNLLNLLQQRQILAGQKDKAWDWNYKQKYLSNLAKSQALRGAANANEQSAVNDASSVGTSLKGMGAFSSYSNKSGMTDTTPYSYANGGINLTDNSIPANGVGYGTLSN